MKPDLKQLQKQTKSRVKSINNKILKAKGKELNEINHQRNIAKLWKTAKQHDSTISAKTRPIQCPGLAKHFEKHFDPDHSLLSTPPEIENAPEYIQILRKPDLQINNSPINEEISNAIKQLND